MLQLKISGWPCSENVFFKMSRIIEYDFVSVIYLQQGALEKITLSPRDKISQTNEAIFHPYVSFSQTNEKIHFLVNE